MADRFKPCSVSGCNGNAHWEAKGARGWCVSHYYRWKRNGDPLAGRVSAGEPMRYLRAEVLSFVGDECLVWPFARNSHGYGVIAVDGAAKRVSRMVCEEKNGPPPTMQHEAAHSCGRGHHGCCNPAHLAWATPAENSADKIRHGTDNRGERHRWAKVTREQVRKIRSIEPTISDGEIATRYGLSRRAVGMIRCGKTWAWLP